LIHRWIGLGLGLYLVILGATGSLMVWHRKIDATLNADLYGKPLAEAHSNQPIGSDAVASVIRDKFPDAGFCALDYPRGDVLGNYRLVCPDDTRNLEVFVSAENGEVIGTRDREELGIDRRHIVRSVYLLHADLLLGETGRMVGVTCPPLAPSI
jgi:uncharacterized iron-regulated membrane protein